MSPELPNIDPEQFEKADPNLLQPAQRATHPPRILLL
jgi:arsenic resistance protein ArsH